jgi:cellulose synthase/poly-beta-1,6-N-acetylglucosamine synthase-like glycosyltransferase
VLLSLAQLGLAIVLLPLSLLTLYLLVLTAAAIVAHRPRTRPPAATVVRRFAVLVPAHNEEALLGRLLASLSEQDYPADRFDVCVVADNCVDSTAAIARSMGAQVYERTDPTQKAKGFALRWLLQTLRERGRTYDAYVVFDADSVAAPDFLRAMNARLERGSQVIQAYYSVQNAGQSAVAGLRFAALAAIHYVRPLGRSLFGLSCGLKGNGMCFSAPIIERFGWNWFTLAEDVEFHLALIRAGVRVDFAPETTVHADMPVTLAQAASQNARWEQGRLQLIRRSVPGLLIGGLRQRSLVQLDAAAEQLIPPLSVPFALSVACVVLGLGLGTPGGALVASINLAGQVAYLLCGLALVHAPRGAYLSLLAAPMYIVWKLGLYARSLVGGGGGGWVRTARTSDSGL